MSFDPEAEDPPRPEGALAQDVGEYETMARDSAAAGQLLTAIAVARDGLARFGSSRPLQRLLALALAQTGALDAARVALDDVLKSSSGDVEALCLIGRVYKELWRHAPDSAEGMAAIRRSCEFYGAAFERDPSCYPGINLAFTLAAAGERARAIECARKVAKLCRAEIARTEGSGLGRVLAALGQQPPAKPSVTEYGWALATLAEALLHLEERDDAAAHYRRAAEIFRGRWRDLASMRRQAREILRGSGQPEDWLDRCFGFPSVVVFSGHMIDAPGRPTPRFPPERAEEVRDAIRLRLQQMRAGFGYSSAASGADILFCECLLEMDAKVNLVLPCPVDSFKRQSVSPGGPDWERRFHHVLAHAASLTIANPAEHVVSCADPASSIAFVYAARIVTGLAVLQASSLDLELKALTVWNGRPGDGPGGTASIVAEWRSRQFEPEVIALDPAGAVAARADVTGDERTPESATRSAAAAGERVAVKPTSPEALQHEIKAIVVAEVVKYADIGERQIPALVRAFGVPLAQLVRALPAPPLVAEFSGGKSTHVFDGLGDAVQLALGLRDLGCRTAWPEHGLPAGLTVRIFVHAGPVFVFEDPALQRTNCLGAHLTRAVRILPVVPPGQIYVSQEFAALCGADKVPGVNFEYLGELPTAQLFTNAPLYRLDRAADRTGRSA